LQWPWLQSRDVGDCGGEVIPWQDEILVDFNPMGNEPSIRFVPPFEQEEQWSRS
jgi:hypothetical protein